MNQASATDRTQFLQGDLRGRLVPLRPPWAALEGPFDERCSNCGKCIEICPEKILRFGRGQLPVVDFRRGACTFCAECVRICESGALSKNTGAPWSLKAFLSEGCLAIKGVMCRSCGDACETGAIRFRLVIGGFSRPEFDNSTCTGCGACIAPCPEEAIRILPYTTGTTETTLKELKRGT